MYRIAEGPQCQWLLAEPERRLARWRRKLRRRRPELVMCGLYAGYLSGHSPHGVGAYLRAPLIHPLDMPLRRGAPCRCPEGCATVSVYTEGPTHDMTHNGTGWVLHDVAIEWRFEPCGHEFRTICPRPEEENQDHDRAGPRSRPPVPRVRRDRH